MHLTDRLGLRVVSIDVASNTLVDDLLDIVKQHLRVEQANEDALISDYIAAALEATENYLQKDVLPRTYTLLWFNGVRLLLEAGRIRNLAVTTGVGNTDDLPNISQRGSAEFVGAGLILLTFEYGWVPSPLYPIPDNYAKKVVFDSGFDKVAELPGAVKAFVYAMVGMLYENREIAGVVERDRKYAMAEIPTWLLDPLKIGVVV